MFSSLNRFQMELSKLHNHNMQKKWAKYRHQLHFNTIRSLNHSHVLHFTQFFNFLMIWQLSTNNFKLHKLTEMLPLHNLPKTQKPHQVVHYLYQCFYGLTHTYTKYTLTFFNIDLSVSWAHLELSSSNSFIISSTVFRLNILFILDKCGCRLRGLPVQHYKISSAYI